MDAVEQQRFVELAYPRAMRAAQRAFKRWHSRKRDDAVAECLAKVWATWVSNLEKGKDPVALLGSNIRFAILFVRYDRKTAGRARGFDVFDYRAGMKRQQLDGQGQARPIDRSDPLNGWIEWAVRSGDDPAAWAAALEEVQSGGSRPTDPPVRRTRPARRRPGGRGVRKDRGADLRWVETHPTTLKRPRLPEGRRRQSFRGIPPKKVNPAGVGPDQQRGPR